MAIDLSKLSAKELYELAMRKEQEEQQQAQRLEQLTELQKQRTLLMSSHQVALSDIEKKIGELTSLRGKLIAEHEKSMNNISKEISDLSRKIQEAERVGKAVKTEAPPAQAKEPLPAPPKAPEPPARETPAATPAAQIHAQQPAVATPPVQSPPAEQPSTHEEAEAGSIIDNKDELFEKIRDLLRTRSFISHGLLKEQLKVRGYTIPNLSKLVDQLIREGKLSSAGGGNYSLGKRA